MRFLIQRVLDAAVDIDGRTVSRIGKGYLVLIGCCDSDTTQTADFYIRKLLGLRIFEDENGKTNLSLKDTGASLLLVSQFTLYADCRKGNRPGFTEAGDPAHARMLYEYIVQECRRSVPIVETGEFGADMKGSNKIPYESIRRLIPPVFRGGDGGAGSRSKVRVLRDEAVSTAGSVSERIFSGINDRL